MKSWCGIRAADMLLDLGYTIVEAASAGEAAQLPRTGRVFDVIVADHLMPAMTGADLSRYVHGLLSERQFSWFRGYADLDEIYRDMSKPTQPFHKDELANLLV